MKAKEYAKKYNDNPTTETLAKIANSFMREIEELILLRHAKSNSACIAILNELDQKWSKFSSLVPDVRRNGFRLLVKELLPEMIEPMGWGNLTLAAPDAGRAEVTSGQVIPPAQVS